MHGDQLSDNTLGYDTGCTIIAGSEVYCSVRLEANRCCGSAAISRSLYLGARRS
jgi:hypothetical protein